jgi:hypothetical protein
MFSYGVEPKCLLKFHEVQHCHSLKVQDRQIQSLEKKSISNRREDLLRRIYIYHCRTVKRLCKGEIACFGWCQRWNILYSLRTIGNCSFQHAAVILFIQIVKREGGQREGLISGPAVDQDKRCSA